MSGLNVGLGLSCWVCSKSVEKCEATIECVSETLDWGCGAPLADIPAGSCGSGWDFLPSVWLISVLTRVLMRTVESQWAFISASLVGGYFRSCLPSSWVFRRLRFLWKSRSSTGRRGCYILERDRSRHLCVFGWLKAGRGGWGGGGLQPDAGPAAAWLCGRGDTLEISGASKVGLSQTLRGDNPYFIYILLSFPTTCRDNTTQTQSMHSAWHRNQIWGLLMLDWETVLSPTPWGALQSSGTTLLDS